MSMHMRPDWAIIGISDGEGCTVIASDTLTTAELKAEFELRRVENPAAFARITVPGVKQYRLHAEMNNIVTAYGRDYAEALRLLFDAWTPQQPAPDPHPELGRRTGTKALPA